MNETNLVFIVASLVEEGYTEDFKIIDNLLYAVAANKTLAMDDFDIDASYKIISEDTNEDVQRLFAITSKDNVLKGLLIDSFDNLSLIESISVQTKFTENNQDKVLVEKTEDVKYGLPKIKKNAFSQNPERYIFRIGFPDFPACPFGNKFEALGWDKEKNEYVWLVTSIIRDNRLIKEEYNK